MLFKLIYDDKWVHAFPKGISPKVNIIGRLGFVLTYKIVTGTHFSQYPTESVSLSLSLYIYIYIYGLVGECSPMTLETRVQSQIVSYQRLKKWYLISSETGSLAKWVECSPIVRETWVQSQVVSYQELEKWYLIPPCLTLSNIRYISRVKKSNPGKRVAPSPTSRCSSY